MQLKIAKIESSMKYWEEFRIKRAAVVSKYVK